MVRTAVWLVSLPAAALLLAGCMGPSGQLAGDIGERLAVELQDPLDRAAQEGIGPDEVDLGAEFRDAVGRVAPPDGVKHLRPGAQLSSGNRNGVLYVTGHVVAVTDDGDGVCVAIVVTNDDQVQAFADQGDPAGDCRDAPGADPPTVQP